MAELDDKAQAFINVLHRGGKFAYWWTSPRKQSTWFPVGEFAPLPTGTQNIYMGVHPVREIPTVNAKGETVTPQQTRSQIEVIAAVNCLFAEFDLKDFGGDRDQLHAHLAQLQPRASVVVDSGGGYHLYWLLNEPFILDSDEKRLQAIEQQAGWVEHVGADPASKDLARVLRVPGTRNIKYNPAPIVTIKRHDYVV